MGKVCTFPKVIPDYTWSKSRSVCPISGIKEFKIKQVALGEAHTLVLTAKGSLFTFGWNEFGQLGVDLDERETSGIVSTLPSFIVHKVDQVGSCCQIAAGAISSFAITEGNA